MKRIVISSLFLPLLFSGCMKAHEAQVEDSSNGSRTLSWNSCSYTDVPPRTEYTGPLDPESYPPGFGIHPNPNYDKGWTDGYADAVFYFNYYGGANPSCSYEVKTEVLNTITNQISYQPWGYVAQPNELTGLVMSVPCYMDNWSLVKCLLHNELSSKTYLMQLKFNDEYTGPRTQAQKDYDKGKYMAYLNVIQTTPFTAAP